MANSRIVNTPSQAIPQSGTVHKQRTVSSTAVPILNWTPNASTEHFLIQITNADIRVIFDGVTDPTSTKGFRFPANSSAYWTPLMMSNAKAIREGSVDAVIEAQELNYL